MIKEFILKKALESSVEIGKELLKESETTLISTVASIEQSIQNHLRFVNTWTADVSFADMKEAKYTTDIYILLDLYVYPRRYRIDLGEPIAIIPITGVFDRAGKRHVVLLGLPGAGKTTSMKYLCRRLILDEDFCAERFSFPIVVRLRELGNQRGAGGSITIIDRLCNILGLTVELPEKKKRQLSLATREELPELTREINIWLTALREKLVINSLEQLRVLLVLDGFDELATLAEREQALEEIRTLAAHLDNSTMIITSRTGEFVYHIENAAHFEIGSLTREQVSDFILRWLGEPEPASDLIRKIYESPFGDTAIRPLTLAHLCAVYERSGRIPDRPKTIYKKIVHLLLEHWDQQRSVKRYSRYGQFEVDRKFDFLCQLAYVLTTSLQRTVFSDFNLSQTYGEICMDYGLALNEGQAVVSEVETQTGLFLQVTADSFEFAHKSLQEYLTAEYLVKLPKIPLNIDLLFILPNELAIAVAISSNPSAYLSELINNRLINRGASQEFLRTFLTRLLLEKPDFNLQPEIGLACIFLYSEYLQYLFNKEVEPFQPDRISREFEEIVKHSQFRSSVGVIVQNYETKTTLKMADDRGDLHYMVKKKAPAMAGSELPMDATDLPQRIYVRNSFFSWHRRG